MELIASISQILIATSVAFVAWKQYQLSGRQAYLDRERLKHELFGRRYDFINDTSFFVYRNWDFDVLSSFDAHIAKAKLLFPKSAVGHLTQMRYAAEKHVQRMVKPASNNNETPEERIERIEESLVQALNSDYKIFISSIEYLITIEDYNA
ncbi:hypothetical protein [Gilvimarinus sp. DA14]|uniref:hypothetical protein n=1 Tax=Gilvimarinus sp. DA14 TaxID=2956798 RepID=UPI0020B769AF|nr:hypothetical protein [Gilvimarinus sp. DA14]UTF58922.1 hypothetical protein NHM04_10575 [Gilvimarinus sp. DA14]